MKKEKRNLFETLFGKKKQEKDVAYSEYNLLRGYEAYFSSFGELYNNKVARTAIDRIATHAAKLTPKHIQESINNNIKGDINYLLQEKPNEIMTTYDFIYKVVSQLYTYNNAFIFIKKDSQGYIQGFYPILSYEDKLLQDRQGNLYLKFRFYKGQTYTIPYEDLIHLRRFYNEDDFWGSDNKALRIDLETAQVSSEGIKNAIKTTNSLKGILNFPNAMLKPEDIKKNRDQFVKDFLKEGKGSGIGALDSKASFQAIDMKPVTLDDAQLKRVNDNIYEYFGISEKIITNNFSSEEWNAFFEGVIEPLAIQMEKAFTKAIFSEKAIKKGHRIIFTTHRLQYATLNQKIELVKVLASFGLLMKDEARELLELAPLGGDEGEKILQSLNNIDSTIANDYQGGKE